MQLQLGSGRGGWLALQKVRDSMPIGFVPMSRSFPQPTEQHLSPFAANSIKIKSDMRAGLQVERGINGKWPCNWTCETRQIRNARIPENGRTCVIALKIDWPFQFLFFHIFFVRVYISVRMCDFVRLVGRSNV